MYRVPLVRLVNFFAYLAMTQTSTITVRVPIGACGANNRSRSAVSGTATNAIDSSSTVLLDTVQTGTMLGGVQSQVTGLGSLSAISSIAAPNVRDSEFSILLASSFNPEFSASSALDIGISGFPSRSQIPSTPTTDASSSSFAVIRSINTYTGNSMSLHSSDSRSTSASSSVTTSLISSITSSTSIVSIAVSSTVIPLSSSSIVHSTTISTSTLLITTNSITSATPTIATSSSSKTALILPESSSSQVITNTSSNSRTSSSALALSSASTQPTSSICPISSVSTSSSTSLISSGSSVSAIVSSSASFPSLSSSPTSSSTLVRPETLSSTPLSPIPLTIMTTTTTSTTTTISSTYPLPSSSTSSSSTSPSSATLPLSSRTSITSSSSSSSPTTTYALELSNPTALVNTPDDEDQFGISLPFTMSLYTQSDTEITITTNGLLTIGSNASVSEGSFDNAYGPQQFPILAAFPGTAYVYWQYMQCSGTDNQGIYYQIDNGDTLSVEWLLEDDSTPPVIYQYLINYNASTPGLINFYYFSPIGGGGAATIGVQGMDINDNTQSVAYDNGGDTVVNPGLQLNFDTNPADTQVGTYFIDSTFDLSCFPPGTFPTGICGGNN